MSKAFAPNDTRDVDDDADGSPLPPLPPGTRNYMRPAAFARMRAELLDLIDRERPQVVETVSWAAGNGDRSENGDYIYGKKRLREIDRRIRFLTRRLEQAEVVDASVHHGRDQVFFGATVTFVDADAPGDAEPTVVTIVGADEAGGSLISWLSPVARALLKARVGDRVRVATPAGPREIDILDVRYPESPETAAGA